MQAYRVQWEIDIFDAESPEDAARQAEDIMKDPAACRPFFDVFVMKDNGEHEWVAEVDMEKED